METFIRRLPPGSQYWAAVAADVERAEQWVLAHPDDKGTSGEPALTSMTDTNQLLLEVIEQLDRQTCQLVAVAGGSLDPQPPRRPKTALDKARTMTATIRHHALVAEVHAAQDRWQKQQETGGDVTDGR